MSDKYQLPVLLINAETCAEAWIKTVKAVWDQGKMMPNHYEDKPSKEATVMVNISNPLKEPRIHIADFIGTQEILIKKKAYVKEVLEGTIDHYVDEGNLSYTYHRRLWHWGKPVPKHEQVLLEKGLPTMKLTALKATQVPVKEGINQIEYLINKIKEESISRKLQVTTWSPHKDLIISGAPCYDKETEILTTDGWKLFKDIIDNEKVYTLNPLTNEIIVQEVKNRIEYHYNGNLVSCNSPSCNFAVTPNHQMLILHRRTQEKQLIEAKDLPNEFYIKRDGKWTSNHIITNNPKDIPYFELNGLSIPMNDWLRFLAIYLSDGSTTMNNESKDGKKGRYRIRITQKNHKQEYRTIIHNFTNPLGISISEVPDVHSKGCIHFTMYSKVLNQYLKLLGRSKQKYIPSFVKELPAHQIRIFLDTFQLGDSTIRGSTIRYNSTSKKLIDDIQELVLKAGYSGADIWKRKGIEYYELKDRSYKNGVFINKKKNIKKIPYNDKVYCIEVPRLHIIYVRRKGKPMWCGNCLQRLWFRVVDDRYLICETHWRSRDLVKAWSSNVYAMVEIANYVAERVGMKLIQLLDSSNSLHIYSSDQEKVEEIFTTMRKRGMCI